LSRDATNHHPRQRISQDTFAKFVHYIWTVLIKTFLLYDLKYIIGDISQRKNKRYCLLNIIEKRAYKYKNLVSFLAQVLLNKFRKQYTKN